MIIKFCDIRLREDRSIFIRLYQKIVVINGLRLYQKLKDRIELNFIVFKFEVMLRLYLYILCCVICVFIEYVVIQKIFQFFYYNFVKQNIKGFFGKSFEKIYFINLISRGKQGIMFICGVYIGNVGILLLKVFQSKGDVSGFWDRGEYWDQV